MKVEFAKVGDHIITFGDFGHTFYVLLKGTVGVYVPKKDTFNFNQKEYLEFVIPRQKFIKNINGEEDLKLPEYIDILEFDEEGKIKVEALNEFLSIPYRNAQYNKSYVMRSIQNKNKNSFTVDHFIKVAQLKEGFEFGGDALLNNKPRNATIVAESQCILATLDRRPFDSILYKIKRRNEDRQVERVSSFSLVDNYSKSFKMRMLKYIKEVSYTRGQYLFQENEYPNGIFLLLKGSITLMKEFRILRSADNKDTVYYDKFTFKKKQFPFEEEPGDEADRTQGTQSKRIAIGGSIRPNLTKKILTVAKVDHYDVIGAEEVMFDSPKRFVSAKCHSETATLFLLNREDLRNLLMTTKKQNITTDNIEDRLKETAYVKLTNLTNKIKNLKNVTENMGNQMKKKQLSIDEKSFEDVKYKLDREYEKVFLQQMKDMKIIKQSKAIRDINKKNQSTKGYPKTEFYNQLIKDDRAMLEEIMENKTRALSQESTKGIF